MSQSQRIKLTNKQKRGVKRQVDLELGAKCTHTRVFVSKKKYNRKTKHKPNTGSIG